MGGFFRIDYDKKRVFGLDALRAFAIFTVMQGHAETFLYDTKMEFFSDLPLPHGVDIFFVLSGFLIGKSFISYLDRNENRLGSTKILTFYAKTALRILPNYYLLLLINYLLVRFQVISGDTTAFPIWRFATFTQDLFTPFWGFYWESWSLPVQWWFYIFFPLLLVILSRFSKPKTYIPWLCLFFVIASILFRISVAHQITDFFHWDIWMRKTVASRTDNIYFGVMAAWIMCYYPKQWNRHAITCFIVGVALYILSRAIPRDLGSIYTNYVYLTLSALAITLWIPLLSKWKTYKTPIGGFVTRVSILSYAMFLTNLCVKAIGNNVFPEFIQGHGILTYFIFWPTVLILSYLLHILWEKPFFRIRDRIRTS